MDKRKISKIAADQIVLAVATTAVKKALNHIAPDLVESHETTTKVISGVAGYAISDALEAKTHMIVDCIVTKIEARKAKKNSDTTN